jgi:molybdenum cofactor biosynthesis protein B
MASQQHREAASALPPPTIAILTISDTRTEATDESGRYLRTRAEEAGWTIAHYEILKDEPAQIRERVRALAAGGTVQAILTNGGTGIAPRDGTYEAVAGLLDKTLPGFGELFRILSWEEVGPAAMLSRAIGGLCGSTFVFCMPGSRNAVGVAMEKLLLPELAHLVWETQRRK